MSPGEMHVRQGVTEARPTIRFRYDGALPVTFVTLLLPYQGTAPPSYNASIVPAAGATMNVQIKYGETTDLLFAAPDPIPVAGEATPKRAGLIRSTAQRQQRYNF